MEKEYNQCYWKLYRWFKWDGKHFHRDVAQGFRNLWKWFPIIWKDRDWDDHFIFEPLKFKIKNTADYFEKKQRFVGWENEVRYMRICINLIDKIQEEYYRAEYTDYFDDKFNFIPTGDGETYELKIDNIRDDGDQYVSKYPHAKRRVFLDPRFENYRDGKRIHIAMAIIRHEKAKKLLFKILEHRIEHWWD